MDDEMKRFKEILQAAVASLDNDPEVQKYLDDAYCGIGFLRISADGSMKRIAPKDVYPPLNSDPDHKAQ